MGPPTMPPMPRLAAPHLRRTLSVAPINGQRNFVLNCRRLIFEYCDQWGSATGMRNFAQTRRGEPSGRVCAQEEAVPSSSHSWDIRKRPRQSHLRAQLAAQCDRGQGAAPARLVREKDGAAPQAVRRFDHRVGPWHLVRVPRLPSIALLSMYFL